MFIGSSLLGQEHYCVFKIEGTPMLNDSIPLKKGVFVNSGQFLKLSEDDEVVLLDEAGAIYELDKKMYIPFENIEKFTKRPEQTSFTLKYLKFIWKKLWENEEKDKIGVVFRASFSNKLLKPADSVSMYSNEIVFKWQEIESNELIYVFIRNLNDDALMKIATNGNTLILPIDNTFLTNDNSYHWSVSTEPEPEIESLNFYAFDLLSDKSLALRMDELKGVEEEFKALGFTEEEIKKTFCEDRKICFD